jgi:multidrug efflux system membrane fusion protein
MPVEVRGIGSVEAFAVVAITAQVGGELKKVHFKEGDYVKKGELLFSLDTGPFAVALAEAKARRARNESLAANAKKEFTRYEELIKKDYVTQEEYDRARTNVEAAEAGLRADRGAVDAAALNLAYATIRAPIAGRTGSLLVNAGNLIKANDTKPLVVIRQDKPIYVRFSVPEIYLARIRAHMKSGLLAVEASPRMHEGPPARGEVSLLENAVDTSTGTIELKALFANDDELLWPGQYVDVALRLDVEKGVVVVPRAAIITGREGTSVFVVKADKTVEARTIVVERYVGDDAVLQKGLHDGEAVVIDGQLMLTSGAKVELKPPKERSHSAASASAGARAIVPAGSGSASP